MVNSPFQVGDIVSLKTHPYRQELTDVLISGNSHLLPPLMTIIEVVREEKTTEGIDGEEQKVRTYKCKCIWYSSSSHQFKEKWINCDQLQLIVAKDSKHQPEEVKLGRQVALNTFTLEANKERASVARHRVKSFDTEAIKRDSFNTKQAPLPSFVSPIMQVSDIKLNDAKEPLKCKKTGEIIRVRGSQLVKCIWFSPLAEKFSELFIPLEALYLVPAESPHLHKIDKAIKKDNYLKITQKQGYKNEDSFVKPIEILFKYGVYTLVANNLVSNKEQEFVLDNKLKVTKIMNPVELIFPNTKHLNTILGDSANLSQHFQDDIIVGLKKSLGESGLIRIHYINRKKRFTTRTVKGSELDLSFFHEDKVIPYFKGHCYLRGEKRTFKVTRIQKLELLSFKINTKGKVGKESKSAIPPVSKKNASKNAQS